MVQIRRDSNTDLAAQPISARWRVKPPPPDGFYLDLKSVAPRGSLALATRLLHNRGIHTDEQAQAFLHDGITALLPPDEIPGMGQAVDVILNAVANDEGIGIIGDFDADGITATAIIVLTLRQLGVEPQYHLPHRELEGHGISVEALDSLRERGVRVIITVDTGITSFDEISYATSLGMRVVVTDHHIPEDDRLPDAAAIVNRHLSDDPSITDYCGAATAFKLAAAILTATGRQPLPELLPLAAIGTLADQTELQGDNRIIVREGLKHLDNAAPVGLIELTRKVAASRNHSGPYDADFVNFQLAPRLNAPGRLGSAVPSLRLLITPNLYEATQLASQLDEANKQRRSISEKVWRLVRLKIEEAILTKRNVVALEVPDDVPMGVLGPTASRASEAVNAPAFAYQVVDGVARASARSVPGFDLHEGLTGISHDLLRFGGHAAAAGFAATADKIPEIVAHLEQQVSWSMMQRTPEQRAVRDADAEIGIHQLGYSMWDFVSMLAPFGSGNPEPTFVIRGANVVDIRYIGRNQDHVRLALKDEDGKGFSAIGFNLADQMPPTRFVDAVAKLKSDYFRGNRRRELELLDIAVAEN